MISCAAKRPKPLFPNTREVYPTSLLSPVTIFDLRVGPLQIERAPQASLIWFGFPWEKAIQSFANCNHPRSHIADLTPSTLVPEHWSALRFELFRNWNKSEPNENLFKWNLISSHQHVFFCLNIFSIVLISVMSASWCLRWYTQTSTAESKALIA